MFGSPYWEETEDDQSTQIENIWKLMGKILAVSICLKDLLYIQYKLWMNNTPVKEDEWY